MKGIIPFLMICLALIGNSPLVQAADNSTKYTPDYRWLRYFGESYHDSTSLCIGNPVTPECAVETYYACYSWWDQRLCDIAGVKLPGPRGGPTAHTLLSREVYKFVGILTLADSDIPPDRRPLWKEGDEVVYVSWQVCSPREACFIALEDKSDPKRQCPPVECDSANLRGENGKTIPDAYVVRQKPDKSWIVIERVNGTPTMWGENPPMKILNEGLKAAPW